MSVKKFADWETERQKSVTSTADLVEYVGYAAPALIAEGNDPDKVYGGLYQNLYKEGRKRGLFTGKDQAEAQQEFESFTQLPLADPTKDFELLANDFEGQERIEDATRLRSLAESLRAGSADQAELDEVKTTLATAANIQAARINYARDNNLSFIDYPTSDDKRRVWVNPDQKVVKDRATFYGDAQRNAGLVDPRYADVADQLNRPGKNGMTGWKAERMGEAARLFEQRFSNTVDLEEMQEAAQNAIAKNALTVKPIAVAGFAGAGVTIPSTIAAKPQGATKVDSFKGLSAEKLAGSLYDKLPTKDPIREEFTREEFSKAAADTVLQRLETDADFETPENNFVTLPGSGATVPLPSASTLPKDVFEKGARAAGLDQRELELAKSFRTQTIASNYVQLDNALYEFDERYADWVADNADKFDNPAKMVESYVDQMDPETAGSTWLKTKGVLRSIPDAGSTVLQGVGMGLTGLVGWDSAYNMFEDQMIADAQRERDRNMVLGYMGDQPGLVYEGLRTLVPVVADIVIARGAGLAAKATLGATARTTTKLAPEALRNANTFIRDWGIRQIDNVLSGETKGLVGNFLKGRVGKYTVAGAEANPKKIFAAMRRDIIADAPRTAAYAGATASQYGTAFTRSAHSSYANSFINARNETNEDGSRKYTDEEARQMAVADGMISGFITVATMGAMHRFLGPGAEVTTFEKYNIGQLKRYTGQVASAFKRTGLGGDELYNTVRAISSDVLKSAYKNIPKQAFAEGVEEFVDEFTQSVVLDMYNNRELNLGEALENGLKAFVLGGFIGGAVTAVSSGAVPLNPLKAFRKDLTAEIEQDFRTGTAQQLQLDVLGQTIKQLEDTGNSPQTLAVLKDLTRRAQRSFRPVDELITPRDVRDSVVQALNGVEEQDTPARIVTPVAPTAARTPNAVPTQLARKLADRLGIDVAELLTIAPSGEKNGRPQITPNDVRNHYQRKVESAPPPAPEVQQEPVVPAYERTFRELEGRVVVLNNERGRVRISEESGVLLDREDGNPPLEITPNPDMISGEFEGFNAVVDEPARVSPRRAPRRFVGQAGQETEVATVLDNGVMRYGNTDYSLPTEPLFANVRLDDAGDVESMHVRVFAPNGDAGWVFVADESAARLVQAYGNSNINISNAIETAVRTDISRNQAANRSRQSQRTHRRKQRQQQFNGPPLTSRTQRVVDENRDFRLENFVSGNVPAELASELRNAATTLGIDPDVVTDSAELLQLIGGEVAAGLDMSDLATDQDIAEVLQRAQAGRLTTPSTPLELAVTRVLDGQLPTNLLEFMLDSHLTSLSPGKVTAVAKLRAKHAEQIKRHSLNNETDLRDIIGSVARSAKSQLHRATAKLLLETGIPNTRVFFVYLPNNLETAAAYLPNSNAIIVNLMADNGGGPVDALLHELAGHAKLDEAVVNPANENMARVRDELFRLREELWTRAQQVHGNRMPADLRYALEGRVNEAEPFDETRAVREMLAHFKASEKFHKQLAGLDQTGERSFVQKFIDLIARLFGGANPSPTIRRIAESLGNLEQAIREANAPAPYGRTVGQISASRAANLQGQKVGPLFGQPNPNERTDFAWVDHQIKSLRFQPISTADIQDIIQNQAFGMMTGENPNNTVATEEDNVGHNARAEDWLRSRGYDFVRIVGRYDAKGENSFLVPGLTTQDAIDFAKEFQQESTATETGLIYQDGSYRPRTGEDLQKPVSQDDDYFSATLDENGNVVPIRVDYDFDVLVQPAPTAPPLATAEGQQFGALQSEYPTFETTDYSRAVVFDGVNVHVNPQAAAEAYGQLDPDAALAAQQFDLAVAFAAQGAEAEAGSVAQDLGFTPEQLVEAMAQDQLGSEQIQDLVANPNGLGFVLRTFHELSNRNPGGNNARISEAVNRVAALGRQITAKGVAPVTATAADPNDPMANAGQVADQFVNPQPIISMSRVVYAVDPAEVKSRTKPGRTVGTRKPTGKSRTEEGVDPSSQIELSVIRERNPVLYRRMALMLTELPLVARDYPELAKFVADERAKVQKNIDDARVHGNNLKRLNANLKTMVAQELGRRDGKGNFNGRLVTATEFDAYIQADGENFAKDAQGVVRRKGLQTRFKAGLQRRERMTARSETLSNQTTDGNRAYSKLLTAVAEKTNNKRIADLLERQADDIIETLVAQTSENLKTLFDLVPEDLREIAKLWYDGANIIAQGMGTQYGIGLERASAVLAVFSPQKDWFQNVALGQRTVEIWANDQDYAWDDAMSAQWILRGGEPQPDFNEDGSYKWPKGVKPRLDDEADDGLARDENGSIIFEELSSAKKAELLEQAKQRLEEMRGKTLRELNPQQQAWFVRMREETKYANRQYSAVRPEGVFLGAATNPKTGLPIKLAWGGYTTVTKALNILKAADADLMAVVDEELGGAHKVRSFYNNIVDPQNADGHVTMDTHAIAALLWRALSGTSREVSQNFGSGGNSSKDSNLGVAGLYPVFAEPYRRLAKALTDDGNPYLPREVQSVTWEVIRLIFSPESKRDAKKLKAIEETWRAYAAKEIDANVARSQIFSTALGRDLTAALDNPSDAENVGIGTFAWQDIVRRPVDTSTVMQSRSVLTTPAESSMEVRAHVDAKFGSLASKLRVNVVPNFTGVDARYVVEGRQGRAYVEYNPMAFVGEPVAVLEAAMREEFIHAASHAALRSAGVEWVEFYTELAQSLSAEQRKAIKSVYRSARNDVDYGAEFLRMGVQKMLYGTVTEAEMRSRSYAKIQKLMSDVVGWFDSQKVNDITRQVYNDTVRMVQGADTGISRSRQTTSPDIRRSRPQYGPNFDNWFRDSKVVDGDGQPLRVFRGADRDFGADWTGRWFAVDPAIASEFATGRPDDSDATPFVGAYYLSVQNPLVVDAAGAQWNKIPGQPEIGKKKFVTTDEVEGWLQIQDEYDGVLFKNIVEVDGTEPTDVYLVRNQTQIKSATGNRGTYDPADLDVTRSRATYGTTPSIEDAFAAGVGDLFVNQDGDWDSGAWWAGSFRPGGRVDPRVFEIRNYQQQAMELAQMRMKQFSRNLNDAMKAEGNAVDQADLNLALGTTEPTVSDAARRAADDARTAAYAAADEAYTAAPAMKRYRELLNDAKAQYGADGNKAAYTRNVEQARQVLENSREKRARAVAYAAADQTHATAIRDARAASLAPLRAAMRGAVARLQADAPAVAEAVADLRGAVDELSAQLRDELAIDDPVRAVIDQNLGVYLVRRYRLHHEEGYAARLMSDPELAGLRDKGREFFEKSWVKDTYALWRKDVKYAVYSDAEIMSLVKAEAAALDIGTKKLAEYVSQHGSQPNPTAAAAERTNLTRFMQKQEVPAELREVMGEYANPVTNALNTYAELARFLGTQRALNQYTDIGVKSGWLVTAEQVAAEPDKYFSYEPLTKTTKTRGGNPLSNYYAEPEIVEAFESMFNPSPASQQTTLQRAQRAAAWVTGMSMASMTLLSLGFYVRNIVGNGFFMWMNGFAPNLDDLKQSYYGVKEVYGSDLDQFGAKLVALGIAKTNLRENLLRDVLRGVVDNPEDAALRLLSATDELASPRGWLAKSENFLSAPMKKLAEVAAAIDLQYRVAYWAHEIRVLEDAYRNDPNPPTREQIEQMAARVVNRTSQGSQRNPPIVKEFTRSGLGTIFNSFFRFTSEMARMPIEIIGRGLEETRSGNAVLRNRGLKRLTGIGTMTAMVGYGFPELLKLIFGIGDEEEEAARRGLPEYSRDASLLFTRDEDGTINSWDLTFVNPLSMWTDPVARAMNHIAAGRYEQAVLATMRGFGGTLLSPQILTDAMISLYNGVNEYGQPIWLQDDHLGERAVKMAKHIGSTALGARTPKKIWQAVSSYLDGGIYDEEAQVTTPLKIIATEFMPVRQRTYDPTRLAGRAFGELRIRNTDLKADTTKQLRNAQNLSRADVFQILDDHERKNRKIARDLRSISRGFLKLGVSERDLKKVATEKGISERRFNLAYKRGQYERYVPPEALFADIERNLGESGQATLRIRYIREWLGQRGRLNPVD